MLWGERMNDFISLTVVIPAYNAGMTIERSLISLEKQTIKNFNCVIVNDGSTDDTKMKIDSMLSKLSFNVQVINKENGGVVSARYTALQFVDTEFVLCLDADDEIPTNTIERYNYIWKNLSAQEKNIYIGICGLSYDYVNHVICGGKFPENINDVSIKKYMKYRFKGERESFTKTEYLLKKYELGVELGKQLERNNMGNNVSEGLMHITIERENRYYCVNEVFRIYHTESTDSLCNRALSLKSCKESYFNHQYILNHFFPSDYMPFSIQFKSSLYLIKFGLLQNKSLFQIYRDLNTRQKKFVLTMALPFGIGNYILGKKIAV